jgi:hypothetical protein
MNIRAENQPAVLANRPTNGIATALPNCPIALINPSAAAAPRPVNRRGGNVQKMDIEANTPLAAAANATSRIAIEWVTAAIAQAAAAIRLATST